MDAKKCREQADELFSKRTALHSLWQEQAENFYPERADFTIKRYLGTDFAQNLTTSYPVLCRRDLGDQVGTMLRPTAKPWFHMKPMDTRIDDNESNRWLEWAEGLMRRAMYDRAAQFTRAAKEGDNDFSTFGQACISVELNRDRDGLLYRCWHLRDVVWMEDQNGKICFIARKWKAQARDLVRLFGAAKLDAKVVRLAEKKPFEEVETYHMVVASDLYDGASNGRPWVSIYYDGAHDKVIEERAVWNRIYVIPRWQTVSGSQYAFSPATVAALPEARLLQAMMYTLLEAGEKAANPPLVATAEAVRSDIAVYAGGVTWVDMEYDERLGDALRPITQDLRGLPTGFEMQRSSMALIAQAFYLNKLTLPQRSNDMTAYEVGQRVQEYIRGALPLFEPMEQDYNGAICEETFDVLKRANAFGSPFDMPKPLQGAEIEWHFESPLHDLIEQQKGQKFLEAKAMLAQAAELDRNAPFVMKAVDTLRDVLSGIQVPAKWLTTEVEFKERVQASEQAQSQAMQLAATQQGAAAAVDLTQAKKNLAEAGAVAA